MALLPVIKSNEGSGGLLPVIKATPQPIAPAKPLPLQPKIAAAKPLPAPAPIPAAQPLQADNTNIPVVGDYAKLGQLVKQKYPEYQTMDDEELGKRTIAKYPEYASVTRTPETPKETGFVQSLAQGIVKTPVQVYKAASSLVPAFQSKLTSDPIRKQQLEDEAFKRAYGTTDAGYFGKVEAADYQDELGAVGKGFELGGYITGAGSIKNVATQGVKQGLKVGLTQGVKSGFGQGFLGGVGAGLQDENKTVGSVLGSGVVGSVTGGVLGGALGGATGAVGGLRGAVPNTLQPSITKSIVSKTFKTLGGESESGARGYLARQGRNLERAITDEPIVSKQTSSLAKVAGIDDTIARDIQALNPETKQILAKMTDEASKTGKSLKPRNRMEIVGQEVTKRASQLDTILKGLKNKYNAAIVSSKVDPIIVKQNIIDTSTELAQSLENQGVVILPAGKLDFENSILNSANLAPERGAIESIWKELMRASNSESTELARLHNIEKYITGTELPKLTMNNEAKAMVTQIRNSIRERIDTIVGGGKYKKLVGEYRTAKAIEEQIDGIVNSTITDAQTSGLLSSKEANDLLAKDFANKLTRLTNKAGVKVSTFLEAMDNGLGKLGKKNTPIDYETIANFNELLDDLVGASQRGSLSGRLQRQVAGGIQMAQDLATGNAKGVTDKIVGGLVDKLGSASHEEKIRALKMLLK